MKEDTFFTTTLPVWRNEDTVMITISSPKDKNNFYTRLSEVMWKDGEPICQTILTEQICNECRKDPETMNDCKHMKHLVPQWHPGEKSEKLALLMGNRRDIIQQELLGIATDNEEILFETEHVDSMFNTTHFVDTINEVLSIAYVTCDPSGGGGSDLTFACGAFIDRRWVVSNTFFFFV